MLRRDSGSIPAGPCIGRRSTRAPAAPMAGRRGAWTGIYSRTLWDTGQPTGLIHPCGAAALLTTAGEMVGFAPPAPVARLSGALPRRCSAGEGHPPRYRLMRASGGVVVVPVAGAHSAGSGRWRYSVAKENDGMNLHTTSATCKGIMSSIRQNKP